MIKLFISDIDGCLALPYENVDLARWNALRSEIQPRNGGPAFTVCSGRPFPYVEAVSQVLGLEQPVLFEAGGGMFTLDEGKVQWNPNLQGIHFDQLREAKQWMVDECVPGTDLFYDHGKRTHAGILGPDRDAVKHLRPKVQRFTDQYLSELRMFYTEISIDLVPEPITKRHGVSWLLESCDVGFDEMAYIGDSGGDIEVLERARLSFAPANAEAQVRQSVDRITEGASIEGVLEAYRYCQQFNRAEFPSVVSDNE